MRSLSFSRSELLTESEARSAESIEAQSAECRSDVAPNARAAQAFANLDQRIYIYIYIYMYIYIYFEFENAHFSYVLALERRMAFTLASQVTANIVFLV